MHEHDNPDQEKRKKFLRRALGKLIGSVEKPELPEHTFGSMESPKGEHFVIDTELMQKSKEVNIEQFYPTEPNGKIIFQRPRTHFRDHASGETVYVFQSDTQHREEHVADDVGIGSSPENEALSVTSIEYDYIHTNRVVGLKKQSIGEFSRAKRGKIRSASGATVTRLHPTADYMEMLDLRSKDESDKTMEHLMEVGAPSQDAIEHIEDILVICDSADA